MLNRLALRQALAQEGLIVVAAGRPISDSDGWAFAEYFSQSTGKGPYKKALKTAMAAYAADKGKDWIGWVDFVESFMSWWMDKAVEIQGPMYAWQGQQSPPTVIVPSDSTMSDMAKTAVLLGRQAFSALKSDPGLFPRMSESTFRWTFKGDPRWGAALMKGLLGPSYYEFRKNDPPRGWSVDPFTNDRSWADLTGDDRKDYLNSLKGRGFHTFQSDLPVGEGYYDKGVPWRAGPRSRFWEFIMVPVAPGNNSKSPWDPDVVATDDGIKMWFQPQANWIGGKSRKKADLEAALADTEKVFRQFRMGLGDHVGWDARKTLEGAVEANLRKKDTKKVSFYRKAKPVPMDIPVTGDKSTDAASVVAAFQRGL